MPAEQLIKGSMKELHDKKLITDFCKKNIDVTKQDIKDSVNDDNFIVRCVNMNEDLTLVFGRLSHRLRDWYVMYDPETERLVEDHEMFIKKILKMSRDELHKDLGITETMGCELDESDLAPILETAQGLKDILAMKEKQDKYLEKVMTRHCPNVLAVAGVSVGAKLIQHAGSLKRLAMMASSTVQLLGAEKALFSHLHKHTKPPKHGYIIMHPFVQKATQKGKAARTLADKISIAARVDFFKGKYMGDELVKQLEGTK